MTEFEKGTGIVEKLIDKGNYTSVCISGVWFSAWSECKIDGVSEGDTVNFEYVVKGQYKNLKKIETSQEAPKTATKPVSGDEMARMNALRHATSYINALAVSGDLKGTDEHKIRDLMFTVANQCVDFIHK